MSSVVYATPVVKRVFFKSGLRCGSWMRSSGGEHKLVLRLALKKRL